MIGRTTIIVMRPLVPSRPPKRNGVKPAITARGRMASAGIAPRRSPEIARNGEW